MGETVFGILGPLQLAVAGEDVAAPGGRQGVLLALLVCRAGQIVSAERLVDEVWGQDLPAHPANALQQRIAKLRRLLARSGTDTLVTVGGGYTLAVGREAVDATRFEDLLTRGRDQLREGQAEQAQESLGRALALWRGEPLEGVDTSWAAIEAARLRELRTVAVEERIEAYLALGRHSGLAGELAALVAEHPLRERLRAQWMRALAAAGRQAEALQAYDEGRARLADELGIDPSPMLRKVHTDVLAQRVGGTPPPAPPTGTTAAPPDPHGALATQSGPLLGRETERVQVHEAMRAQRLVTLTGPGGVGKTRLALQVAHDLAAEEVEYHVLMVELAAAGPDDVPSAVLEALGIDRATGMLGRPAAVMRQHLGSTPVLLVLDNAEHVLEAVTGLVEDVLAACGGVRFLVTSREALGVDAEAVLPLGPLPVPSEAVTSPAEARSWAAVELFRVRARATDLSFEVDEDTAAAVVALVRRLDGVPLALELAASRVRVLGMNGLLQRLDEADVLTDERRRSLPERHRTMRRTLEWSWDLLDDAQRRAWMAAAVPAGPFSLSLLDVLLPAAGARFTGLGAVTDLVDRSLLQPEVQVDQTFYRMLQPVRGHGLEHLATSGLEAAVRDAHATAVEEALRAANRTTARDWAVDVEVQSAWLPEARQALRWRLSQDDRIGAQRLAGVLGWTWYLTGAAAEGLRWLDAALGEPPAGDIGPVAARTSGLDDQAMLWAAALRVGHPDAGAGPRWAQLARAAASEEVTANLAELFAVNHRALGGDVSGALERAAAQHPGGWLEGAWRLLEAQLHSATGELDASLDRLDQAQHLLEEHGAWWASWAQASLVQLAEVRGDTATLQEAGRTVLRGSPTRPRDAADVQLRCILAMAVVLDGDDDAASEHLRVAATATGAGATGRAMVAAATGYTVSLAGDHQAATRAYLTAVAEDPVGRPYGALLARWGLGHSSLQGGAVQDAVEHQVAGVRTAHDVGAVDALARGLEGLGAAVLARSQAPEAARLIGAAEALRVPYGTCRCVIGRVEAERVIHLLTEQLGDAAEVEMDRGRHLAMSAVLNLVEVQAPPLPVA